jgi:hypothetical protein
MAVLPSRFHNILFLTQSSLYAWVESLIEGNLQMHMHIHDMILTQNVGTTN